MVDVDCETERMASFASVTTRKKNVFFLNKMLIVHLFVGCEINGKLTCTSHIHALFSRTSKVDQVFQCCNLTKYQSIS